MRKRGEVVRGGVVEEGEVQWRKESRGGRWGGGRGVEEEEGRGGRVDGE